MFGKLKQFFSGESDLEETIKASLEHDKTGQVTSYDLHIATAVLLIHIASSDSEIAKEEAEAVCNLIEDNLKIPNTEIPRLVEVAVVARREKGKIDEFVELINDKFEKDQKVLLLAMIWKVVLADSKIERFEERMVMQIRTRLRLSDADNETAREMAEAGKV